jgi:hypothetical protein
MKRHAILLALLTVLSAGAAAQTINQPAAATPATEQQAPGFRPTPSETAAVYEAVARYQIKSWQLPASAYCFRVRGENADKDFLDRLKPLPVKPESDCMQKDTKSFAMSIVDKRTKKSAVLFGLGSIFWLAPTQAQVEGSYLCGSQCMAGGVYHVVLNGDQWAVTRFEVRISQ